MRNQLVERHLALGLRRRRLLVQHRGEPRRVDRGDPAEAEGFGVHLDRDAVDGDRLLDRLGADRQQAALLGIAHHHHVGGDGVAEQRFRHMGEIEEGRALLERGLQHMVDLAALEIEIPIADEIGNRDQVGVDDAVGALRCRKE